ncbi:MAG: Competence protein ComEA, partial [Nocardioides sp.]|nr:Competence protein ComEA [Nocardioides sp.]
MRTRRPSPEHQEAVARRLALLTAELASARPESTYDDLDDVPDEPPGWTDDDP